MRKPMICRREAYDYLVEQLPDLESDVGLTRGALAIAMHAVDDFDPQDVERQLVALAKRVAGSSNLRCASTNQSALLARLHRVLFEEEGFRGHERNFWNPSYSFLPFVLGAKQGMPILLALVYKVVGNMAGLKVEGVKSPRHFLTRVQSDGRWLLIDPFQAGRALSREEAFDLIDSKSDARWPRTDESLATATHRQWLKRILSNLFCTMDRHNCSEDLAAMQELYDLLDESQY